MSYEQILDTISLGVVVLDREYRVIYWNRWMAMHSDIAVQTIVGTSVFDFFPKLNNPVFLRNCKSVMAFGNLVFLSQKLHQHLFPFKLIQGGCSRPVYMKQSCTIGPLRNERNEIDRIYITVQDVTEVVTYTEKLKQLNMTDGLTGIYNRRYMDIRIFEEFKRHQRFKRPLSVILLDIDHFKSINDNYGHQFGDRVLQSVADIMSSCVRNVDIAARYGGEEFCCILPETGLEQGIKIAERIRRTVMAAEYYCRDQNVSITVSLGVSCLSDLISGPDELLEQADKALYFAKRSGRNRTRSADQLLQETNGVSGLVSLTA